MIIDAVHRSKPKKRLPKPVVPEKISKTCKSGSEVSPAVLRAGEKLSGLDPHAAMARRRLR